MLNRIGATSVVGVLVLAVLGALLGPQWDPVPLQDGLEMQTSSTAIGGVTGDRTTYGVKETVVTVDLEGVSVDARISEPIGAPEGRAGVVFVHGAGTGSHEVAFLQQARALAEQGVVAMVPDKRLDTYTTQHRDYVEMAADYAASVELLRAWPGVSPDRVGVYAESEGGWIAPVMSAEDPQIAFVVLVSSPVVPPRQQAAFAVDSYLRNTGVPNGVFRAIPRAVGMALPGGGFEYADFDVSPYQRRTTQPVLVVYGTGDSSMPTVQGAEQVIRDLAIAGNGQYTVRYYDQADHGIKVDRVIVPTFMRDLADWVDGLPQTATASPRIAGATPTQEYVAAPVPQPHWLSDADTVLAGVLGAIGLILVGPVVALGTLVSNRVRGRRVRVGLAPGIAPRLAWFSTLVLATVMALVLYLVAVARLALDYERNAMIVQGGWIGVRVLGIVAVVAGAMLLDRVRHPSDPDRRIGKGAVGRGAVAHGVVWSNVVASVGLLVVLAYWGVFQLGI